MTYARIVTRIAALRVAFAFALLCGMIQTAGAQQGQQGPLPVGVVEMERQQIPLTVTLPGRAVAYQQVQVRPRVEGVITDILYDWGQKVEPGTPLFKLDEASYAATVASNKADLARAEADLPVKQAAYDRAVKLRGSGYSEADVETARSDLASAKAAVESAQAALDFSETQLGWTTIRSPIVGVAAVASVYEGDLVTSGQSQIMTTVTRLDPIYVDMLEPISRILAVRAQIEKGVVARNQQLHAKLVLENGQSIESNGRMMSLSPTVSTSTGTVSARFLFENPDGKILPGMFLRGEVGMGTVDGFLVPQVAGSHGTDGKLHVFIVGKDGKSEEVALDTVGSYNNGWIVNAGIEPGTQVIVNHLKTMQAGIEVKPVPSQINAKGLVEDATPPASGSASTSGSASGSTSGAASTAGTASSGTTTSGSSGATAGTEPSGDASSSGSAPAAASGDASASDDASGSGSAGQASE